MADTYFSISATTRSVPRLPYQRIKDDILGPSYALSLVFVGVRRAQDLNQHTRGKTYIPTVLAFPLRRACGEIYLTPTLARKEARERDMSTRDYIGLLFIHALLHLKGLRHSDTMERSEQTYCRRYGFV